MNATAKEMPDPTMDELQENDWAVGSVSTVDEGKPTVYLSGPIRKVDDSGREWRDEMIEYYGDEFNFRNPLDRFDPDRQRLLNDPENFDEDYDGTQILPSEFVTGDKADIQLSDIMFVGLPDEIARGTSMEMYFAYAVGVPYFVWNMDSQEESGWVVHHAEYIDDDSENVMQELRKYV